MIIAGLWGLLGAFWGSHLFNVLLTPHLVLEDPFCVIRLFQGGNSVFGALFVASFWGWMYLRWKRLSFLLYADAAVPAIALGYTFARIGCFLNGCCFGTGSDLPWSVQFPQHTMAFYDHLTRGWVHTDDVLSLSVHPTQLYHALAGLLLFLTLSKWKRKWPGDRLTIFLALYGFLRFLLQFLRGGRTIVIGFLDINQIVSLIFITFSSLLWCRLGRRNKISTPFIMSVLSLVKSITQKCLMWNQEL